MCDENLNSARRRPTRSSSLGSDNKHRSLLQVIEREQLKFPSGTATAQVIKTLHAVPMDEADDPDPRRVVPRLGACPSRLSNKSEVPLGFRFHSSQSALDWQYSRKTSDILLSTALDGHLDIATIQVRY